MTATATKQVYEDLITTLALPENHKLIAKIPDRPNIFIHMEKVKENIPENLNWLVQHLECYRENSKKVLIYCRNVKGCENIFMFLLEELAEKAYIGPKKAITRIVEMYHSRTDTKSVERIMEGFVKPDGHIRVLISTVAFGMGVNLPNIDVVIHCGIESTALSYWQELGRCARDGRNGVALTYVYPRSVYLCSDEKIKELYECKECLREKLLAMFLLPGMTRISDKGHCNNFCSKCECDFCTCCSNCFEECNCKGKTDDVLKRYGLA